MPSVLCGLGCFVAPQLLTAGAVSREFVSSLDPALDSSGCTVEVYRLERLHPDARLAVDDAVVCRIPDWPFDFFALEDLHHQVEELRQENHTLQIQYSRVKEALESLNSTIEAAELHRGQTPFQSHRNGALERASDTAPHAGDNCANRRTESRRGEGQREVQQLRQQLERSEKKQQETKATVIALRSEFMQLVDMMSDAGASGPCERNLGFQFSRDIETQHCKNWQDGSTRPLYAGASYDVDKLNYGVPFDCAGARRIATTPSSGFGARRPAGAGSPRKPLGTAGAFPNASPTSAFAGQRPMGRPRGTHQRSVRSAGASARQRPNNAPPESAGM